MRRVSGKSLKQFVAEEIAGPLGADFQIGAAESDWGRIRRRGPAPPLPFDFAALDPNSPAVKTLTGPLIAAEEANTPGWRRADIGAANGHANARSVARVMSVVARGGEVDGVRLLSPETIDLIFREQTNGVDVVLGLPLRYSHSVTGCPARHPAVTRTTRSASGAAGAAHDRHGRGPPDDDLLLMDKMGPGIVGRTGAPNTGRPSTTPSPASHHDTPVTPDFEADPWYLMSRCDR